MPIFIYILADFDCKIELFESTAVRHTAAVQVGDAYPPYCDLAPPPQQQQQQQQQQYVVPDIAAGNATHTAQAPPHTGRRHFQNNITVTVTEQNDFAPARRPAPLPQQSDKLNSDMFHGQRRRAGPQGGQQRHSTNVDPIQGQAGDRADAEVANPKALMGKGRRPPNQPP